MSAIDMSIKVVNIDIKSGSNYDFKQYGDLNVAHYPDYYNYQQYHSNQDIKVNQIQSDPGLSHQNGNNAQQNVQLYTDLQVKAEPTLENQELIITQNYKNWHPSFTNWKQPTDNIQHHTVKEESVQKYQEPNFNSWKESVIDIQQHTIQQHTETQVKEEPGELIISQNVQHNYQPNGNNWQQQTDPQVVKEEPVLNNEEVAIAQQYLQTDGNCWPQSFGNFQPSPGNFVMNPSAFQTSHSGALGRGYIQPNQNSFQGDIQVIQPNFGGQPYFWNGFGYNHYPQQFGNEMNGQFGWEKFAQVQQYNLQQNLVTCDFNHSLSNGETSDLGSSINTTADSEDSFNLVDNDHKVGSVVKSKLNQDLYEWVSEDKTLPKGWKKRISKNGKNKSHQFFLSPKNEKFTSRLGVETYMLENPDVYTKKDIEKFRLNYRVKVREFTDWDKSDSTLPEGWFKRQSNYRYPDGRIHPEYQYLSPDQQTFNSRNSVVAFMKTSTSCSEEDIKLVLSGKGRGNGKSTVVNLNGNVRTYTDWENSDSTLPQGWLKRQSDYRSRDGKMNIEYQYLSPDKHKFNSRNAVVAFMKSSGLYSEKDIGLVLSGKGHGRHGRTKQDGKNKVVHINARARKYTDWDRSDTTLPEGWLKRQSDYRYPDGRIHAEYQYLSPDNKKFCSRNVAATFMKTSQMYSEGDIEKFLSGRTKRMPKIVGRLQS